MGLFDGPKPVSASIGDRTISCLICGGGGFWQREVKLNTSGMEFLDMGWANESALGLVCAGCGYVHEFVGDRVQVWQP